MDLDFNNAREMKPETIELVINNLKEALKTLDKDDEAKEIIERIIREYAFSITLTKYTFNGKPREHFIRKMYINKSLKDDEFVKFNKDLVDFLKNRKSKLPTIDGSISFRRFTNKENLTDPNRRTCDIDFSNNMLYIALEYKDTIIIKHIYVLASKDVSGTTVHLFFKIN